MTTIMRPSVDSPAAHGGFHKFKLMGASSSCRGFSREEGACPVAPGCATLNVAIGSGQHRS